MFWINWNRALNLVFVLFLNITFIYSDVCVKTICEYTFIVRWHRTMTYTSDEGKDLNMTS